VCWEACPKRKPYRCGLICTATKRDCTQEALTISLAGFNVLYGIGSIGASIALAVGTSGIGSVIAAFGIVVGTGEFGAGVTEMAATLVSYPFCTEPKKKTAVVKALEKARVKYHQVLNRTLLINIHFTFIHCLRQQPIFPSFLPLRHC
jgi:hypothetical protein